MKEAPHSSLVWISLIQYTTIPTVVLEPREAEVPLTESTYSPETVGTIWDRIKLRLLRISLSFGRGLWLRRIFDALSYLGVFQKSYDERFTFPNMLWYRWGFDREEMQHGGWSDALHPDDRDFIVAELDRQMNSADFVELPEYRIITRSGETKWVLSKGVVVERTTDGTISHYLGADFDVTRQKIAEQKVDALLHERTMILSESRHRIKNQVRALDIQIERLTRADSVTPDELASLRSQLHAIQNINRALTGTAARHSVDAKPIVDAIISDTCRVFDPEGRVDVRSMLESVLLPSEKVTVLAYGVQETVTNAFTHASPEWLRLEMYSHSDAVSLRVTNSGVLSTSDQTTECNDGKGLVYLREIVENADGTLETGYLMSDDEWTVVIRLPRDRV